MIIGNREKERNRITLTHLPTGYVISCAESRHAWKNRNDAVRILLARLQAEHLGLEKPTINEDVVNTICPICEEGILTEVSEYLFFTYNENYRTFVEDTSGDYKVDSRYLVCSHCKSEMLDTVRAKYNKETMLLLYKLLEQVKVNENLLSK